MTDYDADGFNPGERDTIRTWTGKRVNPLNLQAKDVDIADIAHSLARQCRYQGYTGGFLSVARHSILVAQRLEQTKNQHLALWGLLHDSSEAYLGDVPRPIKYQREMEGYQRAEEQADQAIAQVFKLPWPMPEAVHAADKWVLLNLELPDLRENYNGNYKDDERDFLLMYDQLTARLSTPTLIGLMGYAGSGKDTVADYLVEHNGFTRLAFADTLREVLYALNPLCAGAGGGVVPWALQDLVDEQGWDAAKNLNPSHKFSVRSLLQRLGTEAGRAILGEDIWVNTTMEKVGASDCRLTVISDVRFPNEYDAIKKNGGEVWRVDRPSTRPVNAHLSETALDGYPANWIVPNLGSIEDLHRFIHSRLSLGLLADSFLTGTVS